MGTLASAPATFLAISKKQRLRNILNCTASVRFRFAVSLALLSSGLVSLNVLRAAEQFAVALPEGVKAVWDLDKAFHETTPTRERVCLNGLWRWQPAPR